MIYMIHIGSLYTLVQFVVCRCNNLASSIFDLYWLQWLNESKESWQMKELLHCIRVV